MLSSQFYPEATNSVNSCRQSRFPPHRSREERPLNSRHPGETPASHSMRETLQDRSACHCYENSARPPHIVIPAKSLPRIEYGAGIQSQRRGSQSTLKHWAGPVFIPLCGLRKAIVIPNVAKRSEESKVKIAMKIAPGHPTSSYRRKACPVLDTGPVSSPSAVDPSLR